MTDVEERSPQEQVGRWESVLGRLTPQAASVEADLVKARDVRDEQLLAGGDVEDLNREIRNLMDEYDGLTSAIATAQQRLQDARTEVAAGEAEQRRLADLASVQDQLASLRGRSATGVVETMVRKMREALREAQEAIEAANQYRTRWAELETRRAHLQAGVKIPVPAKPVDLADLQIPVEHLPLRRVAVALLQGDDPRVHHMVGQLGTLPLGPSRQATAVIPAPPPRPVVAPVAEQLPVLPRQGGIEGWLASHEARATGQQDSAA